MTNWDGYYTYSGNISKISTSENATFQIQYLEIERTEVDEIQTKSDETPEDSEFNQWLNNWAVNKISEENWANLTNMKINLECKLGENVEHEHLVFVKIIEDSTEYGEFIATFDEWLTPEEQRRRETTSKTPVATCKNFIARL